MIYAHFADNYGDRPGVKVRFMYLGSARFGLSVDGTRPQQAQCDSLKHLLAMSRQAEMVMFAFGGFPRRATPILRAKTHFKRLWRIWGTCP